MFRQLFTTLKGNDVLDEAFSEFDQMLEHAEWMFGRAVAVLQRDAESDALRDAIYERDKAINELLRQIRRRIVRHLTVNPGNDAIAALMLFSVAKDAERIGDYCKNVFEVGQFYSEKFTVPRYQGPLEDIQKQTGALFSVVRQAFSGSDDSLATQAAEEVASIRTKCDMLIEQLLLDASKMKTHEAVAYSLLARHYKRVAAHLANIATAVRGKVEDLDFKP